jgi:hypothetical protein
MDQGMRSLHKLMQNRPTVNRLQVDRNTLLSMDHMSKLGSSPPEGIPVRRFDLYDSCAELSKQRRAKGRRNEVCEL